MVGVSRGVRRELAVLQSPRGVATLAIATIVPRDLGGGHYTRYHPTTEQHPLLKLIGLSFSGDAGYNALKTRIKSHSGSILNLSSDDKSPWISCGF